MSRNALPAILAFAPAILLPVALDLLRPRLPHTDAVGMVLGSAPDFLIGFCLPFSVMLRPRLFRARTASRLFHVWCALTIATIVAMELYDPFGVDPFDSSGVVAGVLGTGAALLIFRRWLRRRLTYADPPVKVV